MTGTAKRRAPLTVVRDLESARLRLTTDANCSDEVRAALADRHLRTYLDSWVLPEIEWALGWARGEHGASS